MPTEPPTATDPQHYLLSTIRQSQATVIDTLRAWTTLTEQLTHTLRLPIPELDLPGMVDRAFDLADQTLTAHHQLARTLAGVATHQLDTAAETADTAVAAAESTDDERLRRAEQEQRDPEQPQTPTQDPPKAASPNQNRRPDGRTYEERTLEELRERAAELELEGRSTMTKDDLITALRQHTK